MIIIVESGATKSDWRKIDGNGSLVSRSLHHGTNVSSMKMEKVKSVLAEGLETIGATQEDRFYLYTAGVITEEIRKDLQEYILSLVKFDEIDIQNDLVGAARGALGHQSGVAAIMGTGSNTCFYDGKQVSQTVYSGGFILGDDGSASVLGKMFINDYLKKLIPEDVARDFESKYDGSYMSIVENVYRSSAPAAYLGGFAPFIMSHYDNPHIKRLVDSNFQNFIDRSLKTYDTETYPVGIVGGFAYACRDIFAPMCEKAGIRLAGIIKEPIEGLINYHLSE